MVRTKRSYEGVILFDHRESPGISDETIYRVNTHTNAKLPFGAGHGTVEMATFSCSHCPNIVYIHPLRNRPRGYCKKCDHYICDTCNAKMALDKECKTYKQQLDELQEANFLKEQNDGQTIILSQRSHTNRNG